MAAGMFIHCRTCMQAGQKDSLAAAFDGEWIEIMCKNHEPPMPVWRREILMSEAPPDYCEM